MFHDKVKLWPANTSCLGSHRLKRLSSSSSSGRHQKLLLMVTGETQVVNSGESLWPHTPRHQLLHILCVCVCQSLNHVQLFVTPWSVACQGPLQARILEWVAIPFSRVSSWPRDWTWVSCIAGRLFTIWATREAHLYTSEPCNFPLYWTQWKKPLWIPEWLLVSSK